MEVNYKVKETNEVGKTYDLEGTEYRKDILSIYKIMAEEGELVIIEIFTYTDKKKFSCGLVESKEYEKVLKELPVAKKEEWEMAQRMVMKGMGCRERTYWMI